MIHETTRMKLKTHDAKQKKPNEKNMHTVQFQFQKVYEQPKLTYEEK